MDLSKEFAFPTKIRFSGSSCSDIAAIYADRLVQRDGEVSFYLGKVRVAVLGEASLVIGSRSIGRNKLDPERPYREDPVQDGTPLDESEMAE
jgi:hypothetical protein